jgi:hypothetical protein
MPSSILGITGIILTYVGIGTTLVGVAWTVHSQGIVLENPAQQTRIGRQLRRISWLWFSAGILFLGIALATYLLSRL